MPITLLPPTPVTAGLRSAAAPAGDETTLDRLLKLVPTEVITAYAGLLALAPTFTWRFYEPAIAALGVVAVVLVLRRDGQLAQLTPSAWQYALRCAAFVAWTFIIGNPLAAWGLSSERAHAFGSAAAILLPLVILLVQRRDPPPS